MGFISGLLRLLGAVAGLVEISHRVARIRGRTGSGVEPATTDGESDRRSTGGRRGAVDDASDRGNARLEIERARFEAERRHENELLRLERLRQAAARQGGELRLIAWIAVAGWLASSLLTLRIGSAAAPGAGVLLGTGWAALLATLACVLVAHARLAREHAARLEDGSARVTFTSGAGTAARWLLVAGLGLTGAGFLLRLG